MVCMVMHVITSLGFGLRNWIYYFILFLTLNISLFYLTDNTSGFVLHITSTNINVTTSY